MNKNLFIRTFCITVVAMLSIASYGQSTKKIACDSIPNPNFNGEYIKFTTNLNIGDSLYLVLNFADDEDTVLVEGIKSVETDSCVLDSARFSGYLNKMKVTSHNVVIKGHVTVYGIPDNKVSSLDISHAPSIFVLDCNNNEITDIRMCSENSQMMNFGCVNNLLTTLDVTKQPLLEGLACASNALTELDLSQNPKLTTLNAKTNMFTDVSFAAQKNLTDVYLDQNYISSIDVSQQTDLAALSLSYTQVSKIDVSKNTHLAFLNVGNTNITELDPTTCPELTSLYCENLGLIKLDVTKCTELLALACQNNYLDELDLSQCPGLQTLNCEDNQIKELNINNLTDLSELYCYSNEISELVTENCTNLKVVNCYDNELTSLDVSKNGRIEQLICFNNALEAITFIKEGTDNLYILTVAVFSNKLDDIAMNDIAENLRSRQPYLKAKFFAVNTHDDNEGNILSNDNIKKLTAKGWTVYDYDLEHDQDPDFQPTILTDINNVKATSVSSTDAIYTIDGRKVNDMKQPGIYTVNVAGKSLKVINKN